MTTKTIKRWKIKKKVEMTIWTIKTTKRTTRPKTTTKATIMTIRLTSRTVLHNSRNLHVAVRTKMTMTMRIILNINRHVYQNQNHVLRLWLLLRFWLLLRLWLLLRPSSH